MNSVSEEEKEKKMVRGEGEDLGKVARQGKRKKRVAIKTKKRKRK